jgi:transcriptional regulator with XRE-family HTH domain
MRYAKLSAVHKPAYQYLLKRLRLARHVAELSQEEAGRALGKDQKYISKCELGERRIDPIDLAEFAHVYKQPFSFFIPKKIRLQADDSRSKKTSPEL